MQRRPAALATGLGRSANAWRLRPADRALADHGAPNVLATALAALCSAGGEAQDGAAGLARAFAPATFDAAQFALHWQEALTGAAALIPAAERAAAVARALAVLSASGNTVMRLVNAAHDADIDLAPAETAAMTEAEPPMAAAVPEPIHRGVRAVFMGRMVLARMRGPAFPAEAKLTVAEVVALLRLDERDVDARNERRCLGVTDRPVFCTRSHRPVRPRDLDTLWRHLERTAHAPTDLPDHPRRRSAYPAARH